MIGTVVLEAISWCMKMKRLGVSRWKVQGLNGPRKGFTDGGFENGNVAEIEKQNHRSKRNPES